MTGQIDRFEVFVRLADGARYKAGTLLMTAELNGGRFKSEFQYDPEWLSYAKRFPLDPESLPLGSDRFRADRFEPPLGFVNDALPDSWGRKLLYSELGPGERTIANLLRMRSKREVLGALEIVEFGASSPSPEPLPLPDRISLGRLLDASAKFESNQKVEDREMLFLLRAGSTPGGARPKALVTDGSGSWIAKFPRRYEDGEFDIPALEMASLDCAHAAGLDVPEHKLVSVGKRVILLVKRFDVEGAGRRHMVSLSVLCKETSEFGATSYDELANAIRRHSGNPEADLTILFRQAAFNGLFGNTDDHLKNFMMLHMDDGYRLSKAYDLLPDWNRNVENHLFFTHHKTIVDLEEIMSLASKWNVRSSTRILDEVISGICHFETAAVSAGVSKANIDQIAKDLQHRLARIGRPYVRTNAPNLNTSSEIPKSRAAQTKSTC
jgi:serine/threonine-protein kinase HipA